MQIRRELWELGTQLWTLPISATWIEQEDVAIVRVGHGLRLLDKQRQVASELLDKLGEKDGVGKWRVMRIKLLQFANQSEKTDPEDVVRWEAGKPSVTFRPQFNKRNAGSFAQEDVFFHELVLSGVCSTPDHAALLHHLWCKTILHCLVNRKLPINMLFMTLYALPCRSNWQNILLKDDPQKALLTVTSASHIYKTPSPYPRAVIARMGKKLIGGKLLAWNKKSSRVLWTVNVFHKPMWYRMVACAENQANYRWGRRNGRPYLWYVRDTLKHLVPVIIKLYGQFLTHISLPIVPLSNSHAKQFRDDMPSGRVRDVSKEVRSPDDLPDVVGPHASRTGDPFDLPAEDGALPDMPVLPPGANDVREHPDVGNGEPGGVPLPDGLCRTV